MKTLCCTWCTGLQGARISGASSILVPSSPAGSHARARMGIRRTERPGSCTRGRRALSAGPHFRHGTGPANTLISHHSFVGPAFPSARASDSFARHINTWASPSASLCLPLHPACTTVAPSPSSPHPSHPHPPISSPSTHRFPPPIDIQTSIAAMSLSNKLGT